METRDFTERFLYHIWDACHLTGYLKTVSGKSLKIISPGRYSNTAGPDFREAVISLDHDIIRGDVEIHKTTYDWKSHGHEEDPNYCGLVLHVVYHHNIKQNYTIDKAGRHIDIFELRNFLDDDLKRIFSDYRKNPELPKEKFCSFFAGETPELLKPLMINYGIMRIEEKKKRFAAEQYFTGFNQLAYRGILEALGYSKNKYQMLQLADMISYSDLKSWVNKGMTKQQLIAIWLGVSGLLDKLPSTFPPEYILKWKELFAKQHFCPRFMEINWHLFRIRPVNHPAVRLLQIADLVYRSLTRSLFSEFISLFSFPVGKLKITNFYHRLYSLFLKPNDFLPEKYRLGKTRLDTIFINIILPLVLLYAENNKYFELKEAVFQIYQNFHALPENHLTRNMRQFMDNSQVKALRSKAIYQQALLHLYNTFCRYHACTKCNKEKKVRRNT